MITWVAEEYEVTGIAASMYLNLVDEQADPIVIATLDIICVLMDTPRIVMIVVKRSLGPTLNSGFSVEKPD